MSQRSSLMFVAMFLLSTCTAHLDPCMDDAGNALALFALGRSPEDSHINFMRYLQRDKTWTSAARVSEKRGHGTALALSRSGQPVAVWRESEDAAQLKLSRFQGGQGWATATTISVSAAAEGGDELALSMNARDDVLVAWTQAVELRPGVQGRAVFASHANNTGFFSTSSRVAVAAVSLELLGAVWDDSDHALLVWTQTDAADMGIDLKWSRTQ